MVLGLKKETMDDLLAVVAAVLIFNSFPRFPVVGEYFQQYPLILFGLAIILIANRRKIANRYGE